MTAEKAQSSNLPYQARSGAQAAESVERNTETSIRPRVWESVRRHGLMVSLETHRSNFTTRASQQSQNRQEEKSVFEFLELYSRDFRMGSGQCSQRGEQAKMELSSPGPQPRPCKM